MKQEIWICRHGNRIDFIDPTWVGHDPHLSSDGMLQAEATGRRLKGEPIHHIFASPFLRAVQTANCIAEELDLDIKIEYGFSEWLNAEWFDEIPQCIPMEELVERFPRVDASYVSAIIPTFPENYGMAAKRSGEAAKIIADLYAESNLLFVGHGLSVHGIIAGLFPEHPEIFPGLCSISKIIRLDNTVIMEINSDSSHLSSGESSANRFN
jgi:broad specificity phosphatase PhoE